MRVLFADDQIPDDDIPDDQIIDEIRARFIEKHPGVQAQDGYFRAFELMRRVRRAIGEDNEVTVANQHAEAVSLAKSREFDVAIIDLGWYADDDLKEADRSLAGWTIAKALDDAAVAHPERTATAQIVYSARFDKQPELGQIAANKGRLPIGKPYEERYTIPLEQGLDSTNVDRVRAACQSLRATLSFVEHLRATSGAQDLELFRKATSEGLDRAVEREKTWDVLTRVLLALSVIIVLVGILSLFFLGVPQGAVTAASGVIIGLVPRLMYGQLKETRGQIQLATNRLDALVTQAQDLRAESSARADRPPGRSSSTP
jgi:hypothetical protein